MGPGEIGWYKQRKVDGPRTEYGRSIDKKIRISFVILRLDYDIV